MRMVRKGRHLLGLRMWIVLLAVALLPLAQAVPAQAVSLGTVVAWGDNSYGEINVPAGLTNVTAIAAGWFHSLALKSDGTVVAWGGNNFGQATVPAGLTSVTAIAAGSGHSLALKSDGTVVAWGYNGLGQTDVPAGLTSVTAIAAGQGHNLALKSDGTVVGWGWNNAGQTTAPAGLTGVTAIAAGYYHSLALKSDGTVVAWGDNSKGQSNVPAGLTNVTAIAAGNYHSLALKSDGTVVAWGENGLGQANVPAGLTGVTAIAAGGYHSLAITGAAGTPPSITTDPSNQTVLAGGTATFSAAASGSPAPTVQWQYKPVGALAFVNFPAGVPGANSPTFSFTASAADNGQQYRAVFTNAAGSATSNAATLTVIVDSTPPAAAPTWTPTANGNGWNNSDVTVTWNWSDSGTGIDATRCPATSVTSGEGQAVTVSADCYDLAGNKGSASLTFKIDKTAPTVVGATPSPAANSAGWYNAAVTVDFSGSDATSGIASCTSPSYSGPDSANASVSGTCTDNAGNVSGAASFALKFDATKPILAPAVTPNPVALNQQASAAPNASDATSGIASQGCAAVDTSSVGAKSVTCTATDNAGNMATAAANYAVQQPQYAFTGFFQPVDMPPVLNRAKAGQSIPIKFSLGGNQGLGILASGSPSSFQISCPGSATIDPLPADLTAISNSGLTYDAASNQYTYVWKTDKAWAGTCRQFNLKLVDGTTYSAGFNFTK